MEFVRKPGAQAAIRRCTDGCFFLTSSLRPVVVEPMEQLDDEDGFSERAFAKKTTEFLKEREVSKFIFYYRSIFIRLRSFPFSFIYVTLTD